MDYREVDWTNTLSLFLSPEETDKGLTYEDLYQAMKSRYQAEKDLPQAGLELQAMRFRGTDSPVKAMDKVRVCLDAGMSIHSISVKSEGLISPGQIESWIDQGMFRA